VTAKSRNATTPMFSSQVIYFGCFQHKYNKHIIAQQTLLFEMRLPDRFFLINFVFPSFFSSDPILTLLPFRVFWLDRKKKKKKNPPAFWAYLPTFHFTLFFWGAPRHSAEKLRVLVECQEWYHWLTKGLFQTSSSNFVSWDSLIC